MIEQRTTRKIPDPIVAGAKGALLIASLSIALVATAQSSRAPIKWEDCLRQPSAWYGTAEAVRIAENVGLYQRASGGWPKNIEMAAVLDEAEREAVRAQKSRDDSTIDNGATYTQLAYLARVYRASGGARFRETFIRGLDHLLAAQYENGGWPQYYPKLTGYYRHITFNDGAMIGVMSLLSEVMRKSADYGFVDEPRRARAAAAVGRGIECILRTQIIVDGRLTAWCAQHDEVTLAPAPARSYEKASLSGGESVGILRFLIGLERPSPRVAAAIEAGVAWLGRVRLNGLRVVRTPDSSLPRGYDLEVVSEERATPLWARFYEIGTDRPIFCGRDGRIKYSLAEIEYERRTGYNWYVETPAALLAVDYPAWQQRWAQRRVVRH